MPIMKTDALKLVYFEYFQSIVSYTFIF